MGSILLILLLVIFLKGVGSGPGAIGVNYNEKDKLDLKPGDKIKIDPVLGITKI